ncbi:hypothetical protein [Alkalihalobacterium chitinilyticum]|uniref:Copper-binding protein n=1 Tax=Alkalihalobacterium chitinilyticum TaxID=2980103 RepID=A0ABT5VFR8_9BACI|nr:hypothetical protein [Alkalihalobacterium chitinilyticum]MDE5414310.1 hypothetical protein [Alkalihalobacterium chitinilyticum]
MKKIRSIIIGVSVAVIVGGIGVVNASSYLTSGSDQSSHAEQGEQEMVVYQETGTFIGLADPHTVEIKTSKGYEAFQLSPVAQKSALSLGANETITFSYTEKGQQFIIVEINK